MGAGSKAAAPRASTPWCGSLGRVFARAGVWLRPRRGALAWSLMGLCVLGWFHGGALLDSLQQAHALFRITDDARQQIFPFFRYIDVDPVSRDYIADYYLACYPLGYFGLYASAAKMGLDPTVLSHWLPHGLLLITILGLAAAALKLGGKLGAFCALALALGSDVYLFRMSGGLPRSFGFPILAVALVGFAYARVWWCAACVLLGALFYPVMAVIIGLALACLLLLPTRAGLGVASWTWVQRVSVLAATGGIAVAMLVPCTVSCSHYGAPIRPSETAEFPEVGPGGRYSPDSRAPFKGFFESCARALAPVLLGGARPLSPEARGWLLDGGRPLASAHYLSLMAVLVLLVLLGGFGLLAHQPAARRVLLLGVAAGIGYTVARLVVPYAYLPERYVGYAAPLLGMLAVATSVAGIFPPSFKDGWRGQLRTTVTGGYVLALLWLVGGRVSSNVGLNIDLRPETPLYERLAALPSNVLVAGWPSGVINDVPYASRRRAFLTRETHQAFHRGYIDKMRRRMRGLIEAYFASTPDPLIRLRDEFGVTHLLVERSHLGGDPPSYFSPYDQWITQQVESARGRGYEVPRQIQTASVYSYEGYELLDLSRIQPGK